MNSPVLIASPLRKKYESRESKDGTTGLFATATIPKYSEIVCESPLLVVPDVFSNIIKTAELTRIFEKNPLNPTLLQFGCRTIQLFVACHLLLQSKTDKRTRAVLKKLNVGPHFRISECEKTFVPVIAAITGCTETKVLLTIGRVHTNAFSITGSLVQSSLGHAVYEDAMFIRHSCDPNSLSYFRVDGTVTFLAIKEIAEGEEITWSYSKILPHVLEERRRLIAESFYFTCACARCMVEEKTPGAPKIDDMITAQNEDEDSALDKSIDNLVGAVERKVNEILANWSVLQVRINKEVVFDVQSASQMFMDLCGRVPFTHPKAFPSTRLLLHIISMTNPVCEHLKHPELKEALLRMAYCTLLRIIEVQWLPPAVWTVLLDESLMFVALGNHTYPDSYGWLVENLIQARAIDLRTMMCLQAFAPKLLGRRLTSLWATCSELRQARAHCPAAFFDVDVVCAPQLPAILDGNRHQLDDLVAHQQCREEEAS